MRLILFGIFMNKRLLVVFNFFFENIFIKLCGILTVIILGLIVFFLFKGALPFFYTDSLSTLFTGLRWEPSESLYGVFSLIYGSLFVTFISLIIAIPLSMATAIFLSEVISNKLRTACKILLEFFSAVPSVVFGFLGLLLIAPNLEKALDILSGLNALTAGVLLAFMSIPTIVSVLDESLVMVPRELKEASYALGANKIQTLFKVSLPYAKSGIFVGFMLGFGRSIGETMTVMMVAGGTAQVTGNLFDPIRTMTSTIAIEMGEVVHGDKHYQILFLIGVILFLITLIINFVIKIILSRMQT